ncbi:hypothetical protein D3D02_16605 [Halobellus sp. Atlit-38R]|nr:hypothetical protein D3D02_16605 [Halobellus sp. Atlit-38R]
MIGDRRRLDSSGHSRDIESHQSESTFRTTAVNRLVAFPSGYTADRTLSCDRMREEGHATLFVGVQSTVSSGWVRQ